MLATFSPLVADLVEWVARAPRPYAEVLDAWRTSCPRLPIWEEAIDLGLVGFSRGTDGVRTVHITAAGHSFLHEAGRVGRVDPPATGR